MALPPVLSLGALHRTWRNPAGSLLTRPALTDFRSYAGVELGLEAGVSVFVGPSSGTATKPEPAATTREPASGGRNRSMIKSQSTAALSVIRLAQETAMLTSRAITYPCERVAILYITHQLDFADPWEKGLTR